MANMLRKEASHQEAIGSRHSKIPRMERIGYSFSPEQGR